MIKAEQLTFTRNVKVENIKSLYASVSALDPFLIIFGVIWTAATWQQIPLVWIACWVLGLFLTSLLRACHGKVRRSTADWSQDYASLEYEFFIGCTISAIVWSMGLVAFLSVTDGLYHTILYTFSLFFISQNVLFLAASKKCFYGLLAPVALVLIVVLLVTSGSIATSIEVLFCVFLLWILNNAFNTQHKRILQATADKLSKRQLTEDLKQANEELRHTAIKDGLTGIANRRHLDNYLATCWRRCWRAKIPLSLILLDIDFFKRYNDSLGHLQGDECLKEVAKVLAGVILREDDLAARYGGEEFVILLPSTDNKGAVGVANRVQSGLAELNIPHPDSLVSHRVTASIGVCTLLPNPSQQPNELILKADQALYQAKGQGRNRTHVAARGEGLSQVEI